MRGPRNPFRMQAAENIESEDAFVRLYSPSVLEFLNGEYLFTKVHLFRSAPGAGKTSLLRLFTPSSLISIHAHRTRDSCRDLFARLKVLGALDDQGPQVAGAYLQFDQNYALIEDLNLERTKKVRLFLSLLNSRVILSVLRASAKLNGLSYPNDLHQLAFKSDDLSAGEQQVPNDGTGHDLYEWACALERSVCDYLDSLGPSPTVEMPGHSSLFSLRLVNEGCLKLNDNPIPRTIVMMDDVHKLLPSQRRVLLNELLNNRICSNVWLAERLEALDFEELTTSVNQSSRDYVEYLLEDMWKSKKRFENAMADVADRRVRESTELELESYAGHLDDSESIPETAWSEALNSAQKRILPMKESTQKYKDWINAVETSEQRGQDSAIAWKSLDILIAREENKRQLRLDLIPLAVDELQHREDSAVRAAADLLICTEFKIPYYCGFSRLAAISSQNIEQFVWLAAEIFEEMSSIMLLQGSGKLSCDAQQRIIKNAISKKAKSLAQGMRHGEKVKQLVLSIAQFSRWATHQPTASYAPGVTGFGITNAERARLKELAAGNNNSEFKLLAEVLSLCVSNNLLKVDRDVQCKGDHWTVFYLNRMWCVPYDLPLQYGGWRQKSLQELGGWMSADFKPPKHDLELGL